MKEQHPLATDRPRATARPRAHGMNGHHTSPTERRPHQPNTPKQRHRPSSTRPGEVAQDQPHPAGQPAAPERRARTTPTTRHERSWDPTTGSTTSGHGADHGMNAAAIQLAATSVPANRART